MDYLIPEFTLPTHRLAQQTIHLLTLSRRPQHRLWQATLTLAQEPPTIRQQLNAAVPVDREAIHMKAPSQLAAAQAATRTHRPEPDLRELVHTLSAPNFGTKFSRFSN